ncbi:MAG: hypothetical protein J2P57_00855 [Acidimicrobiaceae bacterium]|nr:hypothetical protein [Acidimicrobiaceae bacterium]
MPMIRRAAIGTTVLLFVLLLGACTSHSKASSPTTVPRATAPSSVPGTAPSPSPSTALSPPPVPSSGAYLGAWVNPDHMRASTGDVAQVEMSQLSTVSPTLGRPLGILHAYASWSAPAPISALTAISSSGAVPLLDWGCHSTAQINSGQEDSTITAYANALKSYGKPIFLRWFWEMNLTNIQKNRACLGSAGPAGFVKAWHHIHNLFQQVGAKNVAFVWCPGNSNLNRIAAFYPGNATVDWIGIDGYAARGQNFATLFGRFYERYVGHGKPMMVAETGALGADQPAYLSSILASAPSDFPQIKAFVYFDAPGPRGNWSLTTSGLAEYAQLGRNPYFSARA